MKKVLFNCSTNQTGGAIQTATNFILQSLQEEEFTWYYSLSRQIYNQLKGFNSIPENYKVFDVSPANSAESKRELLAYEAEVKPEFVFTMSGPAYVSFQARHLLGCSNPYVTHARLDAFLIRKSPLKILLTFAKVIYQSWQLRKADFWMFQTETSRRGFTKRLLVNRSKTFVVSNTCGENYFKKLRENKINQEGIKILVPSAAFQHKNLNLVPKVAAYIRGKGYKCSFTLTLPKASQDENLLMKLSEKLGVIENICNHGAFNVKDGPELYASHDIIFLPTLLETFSGVYVESMATRRPLVTTDKSFARDVCKDAASYFRPRDHQDAANKIIALIESEEEYKKLVLRGNTRIKEIPTVHERYDQIRQIILKLANPLIENK